MCFSPNLGRNVRNLCVRQERGREQGLVPQIPQLSPSPTSRHRAGWRAPRRSEVNDTLTWGVNVWRPFYSVSHFSVKVIPQYRKAEIQLGKQKKLPQTCFFCLKEKDQKTCPHLLYKCLVKLRIRSKTVSIEQVVISKEQKERDRKRFKCSAVFFSPCSARPCTLTVTSTATRTDAPHAPAPSFPSLSPACSR